MTDEIRFEDTSEGPEVGQERVEQADEMLELLELTPNEEAVATKAAEAGYPELEELVRTRKVPAETVAADLAALEAEPKPDENEEDRLNREQLAELAERNGRIFRRSILEMEQQLRATVDRISQSNVAESIKTTVQKNEAGLRSDLTDIYSNSTRDDAVFAAEILSLAPDVTELPERYVQAVAATIVERQVAMAAQVDNLQQTLTKITEMADKAEAISRQ